MNFTENARLVLNRFLIKDKDGKIVETPRQMFLRIAKNIAKEDLRYGSSKKDLAIAERAFFDMMNDSNFLPNLPTIANAGRTIQQLAACFVLPVPDDMEGIFESVKNMALIQKSGGGTGFSFSKIRPEGSLVSETGGIASGPVSFMKVFDTATGAIKEGGIRRGANMGVLRIDHPDIEKFINCKERGGLSNFNISVGLTDKFLKAVENDGDFVLEFNQKPYRIIKARELFKSIARHAWINGDPGVLFIDEINRHNPTPKIGEIETTNPCGETVLLPYESCILGSINLSNLVNKSKKIDFKKLEKIIRLAVHFLDNSIDASSYPLPQIEKIVKANRKIGLGVMGFADLLIKMQIPYDSEKAEKIAGRVIKFIYEIALKESQDLAKKRGQFANQNISIYKKDKPRRNASLLAIAPTGTIALIANASEGIEPLFGLAINRQSSYGVLHEINSIFKEYAKKYKLSEEILNKIALEGSLQSLSVDDKLKKIFRTAHDISPLWHIRIQAAFQKYVDNSISKTVNVQKSASPEDIEDIFLQANKLKLKGLTVYRYGSRKEQVLSFCEKCGPIF
jgi:ribonucleoside-diphosphate reductase alpha chain